VKDFKKLLIWQKGMEIVKETYEISAQLPDNERFGLRSQITRATVSVPSNIAEGSSKQSKKEYVRFLEIALGSLFELETQVLVIDQLGLGEKQLKMSLLKNIDEEQKMIMSFIKKVGTQ
jgi:four helix bundle protein